MRVCTDWMSTLLGQEINPQQLADQLTMLGLEVESIEPAAASFSGVVVGEVLACEPHADAKRLHVCRVLTGLGDERQIVCGAANVRVGLKVAVILPGGVLPDGQEVAATALRGVDSFGMMCSARELGLGTADEGIMELAVDAPVGEDVRVYMGLSGSILDLDVTPNRGDCLSMQGVMREYCALQGRTAPVTTADVISAGVSDKIQVQLQAAAACSRYVGRVLVDVDMTRVLPLWMLERLRRSGLRSVNPVVDILNYVMIFLGQPMHAFDADLLQGDLTVRLSRESEVVILLDDSKATLPAGVLVVADNAGVQAVAGVMGAKKTAVTDVTTRIMLEAAYFDSAAVTQASRVIGVGSDSSYRFARGVDYALAGSAMDYAVHLLVTYLGCQPGPVVDVTDDDCLPYVQPIELTQALLVRYMGFELPAAQVEQILVSLGLVCESISKGWRVVVPSYRFDLVRPVDLVEEVMRIYGYDRMPMAPLVGSLSAPDVALLPKTTQSRVLADCLVSRQYHEVITYSFIDSAQDGLFAMSPAELVIKNPISREQSQMRASIWPGLLQAAAYNLNRQQSSLRIFELGHVFSVVEGQVQQSLHCSGLMCGSRWPEQWSLSDQKVDFFDIKNDIEVLLEQVNATVEWCSSNDYLGLHPGRQVLLKRRGSVVGALGQLHPNCADIFGLNEEVYLFYLDCGVLFPQKSVTFSPISRFPMVRRDLALVVDEAIEVEALRRAVYTVSNTCLLRDVVIFDLYRDEKLGNSLKSVAVGLIFQSDSGTLKDQDVDRVIQVILDGLSATFGVTLRA